MLVCGDRRDPKQAAIALIVADRRPARRSTRAGSSTRAITESLTALLISMNIKHKTHAGIRITGV